ncbi:siderophore-interacting domain protein [Burkholderia pseudomallei MSHR7343]|nr:siderophore-interacting domain protein [Burkholderia pseudomallei MSHR7343]
MMQHEIEIELSRGAIIAARREIACDGARPVLRKHDAVRAEFGARGCVFAGRREEDFHVIVERRRFEIVEFVACQRHALQMRRHVDDALDLQQAEFQRMTHAYDRALGSRLGHVDRFSLMSRKRRDSVLRAAFDIGDGAPQNGRDAALLVGVCAASAK